MHDLVDVLSCTQCWYHDSWLDQLLRSFLFPNFFLRKRTLVDSNFFPTCRNVVDNGCQSEPPTPRFLSFLCLLQTSQHYQGPRMSPANIRQSPREETKLRIPSVGPKPAIREGWMRADQNFFQIWICGLYPKITQTLKRSDQRLE